MIDHSKKGPHRSFLFRPLKESDLRWLSSWLGGNSLHGEIVRERIHTVFNRHFHHIWHSRLIRAWVMTIDKRPVFCLTLLRLVAWEKNAPRQESGCEYQLHLFASPTIRKNDHKLMLAWQAASIHVFLKLDLDCVQVTIDDSQTEENDALLIMGYRLVETTSEASCITNLYICRREDFRPVL